MKKLLFILLLFPTLLQGQSWWVMTTGSNTHGKGTYADPWATIDHAADTVTSGNIYVYSGNYTQTFVVNLAANVSLIGSGPTVPNIQSNLTGTSLIVLETNGGWTSVVGNQEISDLNFIGKTGYATVQCIEVAGRSNVRIHNCTFTNFNNRAVQFVGQPSSNWIADNPYDITHAGYGYGLMPSYWCSGNRFENNIVTNCSRSLDGNDCYRAVEFNGQDGFICDYNIITCLGRATGWNGYGIGGVNEYGFNKNYRIRYNTITVGNIGNSGGYGFAIELWWTLGGGIISNNTIQGGIDISMNVDYISAGYSVRIYDNESYRGSITTPERFVLFEGICEYVQIYRNYVHGLPIFVYWPRNNWTGRDRLFHVDIYNNKVTMVNCPAGYQTWVFGAYYVTTVNEIKSSFVTISHNTIIAPATNTLYGIEFPANDEFSQWTIENNILENLGRAVLHGLYSRTEVDSIKFINNVAYNCANSDDPVFDVNFQSSMTNYTYSGYVNTDPRLTATYELPDTLSSAFRTGIYDGITTDYYKKYFANPPSIGMSELETEYEPPVPPPVLPSGLLKIGNRFFIYKNRLLKL